MDHSRFCDSFTIVVPKFLRHRLLIPTRSELIEIFNWKGGNFNGKSKKNAQK